MWFQLLCSVQHRVPSPNPRSTLLSEGWLWHVTESSYASVYPPIKWASDGTDFMDDDQMLRREYDTKKAADLFLYYFLYSHFPTWWERTSATTEQLHRPRTLKTRAQGSPDFCETEGTSGDAEPRENLEGHSCFSQEITCFVCLYVGLFPHTWLEPVLHCPTLQNDSEAITHIRPWFGHWNEFSP